MRRTPTSRVAPEGSVVSAESVAVQEVRAAQACWHQITSPTKPAPASRGAAVPAAQRVRPATRSSAATAETVVAGASGLIFPPPLSSPTAGTLSAVQEAPAARAALAPELWVALEVRGVRARRALSPTARYRTRPMRPSWAVAGVTAATREAPTVTAA